MCAKCKKLHIHTLIIFYNFNVSNKLAIMIFKYTYLRKDLLFSIKNANFTKTKSLFNTLISSKKSYN